MKNFKLFLLLIFCFFGCTNPPYRGCDVLGVDEFIIDSYKIKEGKFSILEMEGKPFPPLSPELLQEYKDVIQNGDVLEIAFYHPTRSDLTRAIAEIGATVGFRVSECKIHLPDLPCVCIAGLTLDEAKEKIEEEYRKELPDVSIFLEYKERLERKVDLAGLVKVANLPVNGKLRLFDALAKAQVPPNANLFKSYVVRDNAFLPVDLYKLIKEGDMSQNIVLRGGDKIYIADPAASTLMVLGEVGKEKALYLPNGFMSLREAIAEAQGIPFTGDKSYIQIFRGNLLCPKIYTLNWCHIIHLPGDSLLLMPGDIVYVAATPITEWNRFINQLFPTFIGLDLMYKGAQCIGIFR